MNSLASVIPLALMSGPAAGLPLAHDHAHTHTHNPDPDPNPNPKSEPCLDLVPLPFPAQPSQTMMDFGVWIGEAVSHMLEAVLLVRLAKGLLSKTKMSIVDITRTNGYVRIAQEK